MITAVLDVNVIIAAVLAPCGTPRLVLKAWQDGRFVALASDGIVSEVERKLRSPRIGGRYNVRDSDVGWIRGLLVTQAKMISLLPEHIVPVTGDPEDDYVLATAHQGTADYLVTGDHELLALGRYGATTILTPRQFLALLSG